MQFCKFSHAACIYSLVYSLEEGVSCAIANWNSSWYFFNSQAKASAQSKSSTIKDSFIPRNIFSLLLKEKTLDVPMDAGTSFLATSIPVSTSKPKPAPKVSVRLDVV